MTLVKDEYKTLDTNHHLPDSPDIDSEPESLESRAARCKEIGFGHRQTIIFWLFD